MITLHRTVQHDHNDKGDQSVLSISTIEAEKDDPQHIKDMWPNILIANHESGEPSISIHSRAQMEQLISSLRAVADKIWE